MWSDLQALKTSENFIAINLRLNISFCSQIKVNVNSKTGSSKVETSRVTLLTRLKNYWFKREIYEFKILQTKLKPSENKQQRMKTRKHEKSSLRFKVRGMQIFETLCKGISR